MEKTAGSCDFSFIFCGLGGAGSGWKRDCRKFIGIHSFCRECGIGFSGRRCWKKDLPKSDKVVPYKGWMTEMEKALKKARKENKAVFVALVGHAEWDSGAAALEEVFSDKSFVKAL